MPAWPLKLPLALPCQHATLTAHRCLVCSYWGRLLSRVAGPWCVWTKWLAKWAGPCKSAPLVSRVVRLPPLPPSFFDPNARRVWLAPDATPYQQCHETAHKWQQETQTMAWRAHRWAMHKPWLCRWTRVWIEWQAARMALRTMRWLGTWTHAAKVEAWSGVRSYVGALFW